MAKVIHTGVIDEKKIVETLQKEGFHNIFKHKDYKGVSYPTHTHPYYEVRWILDGELVIEEGGKALHLKPGDRLESLPNTPHSAYAVTDVEYICGSK